MTSEEIAATLQQMFGSAAVSAAPGSWQVELADLRLLILLSEDESWLRLLLPIAPAQDAAPFLAQLLEANFDATQETRYAISQNALWGVFQHNRASLQSEDLVSAVQQLLLMKKEGLDWCFNQLVEERVRQIVNQAKQQGQTLEMTLQTLERFYQEGLMGDMALGREAQEETLAAWRYQLQRFWHEEP